MNKLSIDHQQLAERLKGLYADQSKHAVYQSLPAFVSNALNLQFVIDDTWRGDAVRLDHILRYAQVANWPTDGRWCDFGANTGFFSLSLAHEFPRSEVLAIEANPNHASFIDTIAQAFSMRQRLKVLASGITLDTLSDIGCHDVMLHLNVLHHAGADFDQEHVRSVLDFGTYAENYLRCLQGATSRLVFQMGSNLWGDKSLPIVPVDDDLAKLRLFASWLQYAGWRIDDVSYATRTSLSTGANAVRSPRVVYRSLPGDLLADLREGGRDDRLQPALEALRLHEHPGEFYRRPLFACSAF